MFGVCCRKQAGSVVPAGFDAARSARHRAHVRILNVDAERLNAARVKGAGRRADDVVDIPLRLADAEAAAVANHRGADIERRAGGLRHPAAL
ncbi:hypothetical protein SDC9_84752 [bioreactor metagenome]|uniref:Uncharacterized protein n=1 Tax=bioreactor metagenome TaxID=1076179 RepID=A0A644ZB56_9ZZZZ